ncbi:hypothetical protein B1R27_16000 [Streptomyces sp. GKU 895]|nr:hypothetical protein B1R27_16000 [Streptomyces sp. GKU 895]
MTQRPGQHGRRRLLPPGEGPHSSTNCTPPTAASASEYRDAILTVHQQLGTPLLWCRRNLNVHLAQQLTIFAEEHTD